MLAELQASYTSKLFGLYDEQYKLGYWAGYAEGECLFRQAGGVLEEYV